MEKSKESDRPSVFGRFFNIKYRIIPVYQNNVQAGVLVQLKHWWFPVWMDAWSKMLDENGDIINSTTATFTNMDDAINFINSHRKKY